MPPPASRPVRIIKLAGGEDAATWARDLAAFDPAHATNLKQDGTSEVFSTTIRGRPLIIKRSALSPLALLKSKTGAGRAHRHWRGASWLRQHNIPTAACYAIAHGQTSSGAMREWLVMEHLGGLTLLDHLAAASLPPREEHRLARAVGAILGALERNGRSNRDSKPSNLIVLQTHGLEPTIAIIDSIAIRPLPPGPLAARALARMHASAIIEAIGCGCRPRRSLIMRGILATLPPPISTSRQHRKRERNRRWRAAQQHIETHGNPAPAINPLQRPGPGR